MNETNRTGIILAAALVIVLMAVVIFLAWTADAETVETLDDFVRYLDDHRDNASRLIVTLGALVLIVLALLLIIVEMAPEEETREIRVEQAGATTIVPAEPLRLRLEEALLGIAAVSAARARVYSHEKGVGMKLDLTVSSDANVALVTQEASRVVVETLQADLGLPVTAAPEVRIVFGPAKGHEPAIEPPPAGGYAASSMSRAPLDEPGPPAEPPEPPPVAESPPASEPPPLAEPPPVSEPPQVADPPPDSEPPPPPWSTGSGRPPVFRKDPPEEPPQP